MATKIEELRKKYANTQINLVDLIRLFDPTKNRILTDLLMQEFINKSQNKKYEISDRIINTLHFDNSEDAKILRENYLVYIIMDILAGILGEDTFYYMERFNKYWIEDKLPNRDIYSFKSMEEIKNMVHIVELEECTKEQSVRVCKVYETNEWLIVLPLSFTASQIYGAGTRWCTTERSEGAFWRYTQRGLLFYIINKKQNIKYAYNRIMKNEDTGEPGSIASEFFNAADMRVDSMDVSVSMEVLQTIKEFVKECEATNKRTNSDFPDYDRDGLERYNLRDMQEKPLLVNEQPPRPAPTQVEIVADVLPVEAPVRDRVTEIMEETPNDEPARNDPA